jgi:hypothetical protein
MRFKEFYEREKYIVLKGQSLRFRLIKWVAILILATALYLFKGWAWLAWALISLAVVGVSAHFFFRWKTEGWTKSWGPYRRIPLNGE